ncbi:MAG: PP2C family protein-serine/threonine phosphatase [Bacillaceae bacterium]
MNLTTAYHTDVGSTKKTNQDGLLIKIADTSYGKAGLVVICDGMGGLSQGELASATVIQRLGDWFEQGFPPLLKGNWRETVQGQLDMHITQLNKKIVAYGERNHLKLGTTVTALLFVDTTYYIFQVGDSRAYVIGDTLTQLTKDQTLVARELERGNLTAEQAKIDPRRNILLQCVGATGNIEVVITTGELQEDDVLLLCTDGFYGEIKEEELLQLKSASLRTREEMKEKLVACIELVKSRGEKDNISVILVKIEQ